MTTWTFAKMPNRWISGTVLKELGYENSAGEFDLRRLNASLAALKTYIAICTRTDYDTGIAKTTYEELMLLTAMSRAVISRSLRLLEAHELIRIDTPSRRSGSIIYVCRWIEDEGYGKIPKRWLYEEREEEPEEHPDGELVRLSGFKFGHKLHLIALKIYLVLIAMRNKDTKGAPNRGLTVISYNKISALAGVPRCWVSSAITLLLERNLVTFRAGKVRTGQEWDFAKTNRYLLHGLGLHWTALDDDADIPGVPAQPPKSAGGIKQKNPVKPI